VRSRTRVAFVGVTTTLRLALTLVVAALVLSGHDRSAAVVFAIAAGTDYVDGSLARRWGVTTATGSFLDTTADKVLVSGVLITLTGTGEASPWPVLLIVTREMVVLGLRGSVAAHGTLVSASSLGRTKTALQMLAILLLILRVRPGLGPMGLDAWVLWAATAVTVISGADYLVRWAGLTVHGPRPGSR
jgi:CDP-diacylglycerol--glycerol-3-phosphate 3-phosphatidyltransferase